MTSWTVAVISLQKKEEIPITLGSYEVVPSRRSSIGSGNIIQIIKNRIATQQDEIIDMSPIDLEEIDKRKTKYASKYDVLFAKQIRGEKKMGLLLIYPIIAYDSISVNGKTEHLDEKTENIMGLAFSFPSEEHSTKIEFMVNEIFMEENRNG